MSESIDNVDGTYIVIQGGQRVSNPTVNLEEAQKLADQRNKLQEAKGQPVPEGKKAVVRQNLMG